jgi:ribonuclease P protein component
VKFGCRLPPAARIRSDERAKILQAAPRVRGRWFLVRWASNDLGYARLLVRTAKHVARSAVVRNRIRRGVREVFRLRREKLASCDYFVSLIQPYNESDLGPARQELDRLLRYRER